MAPTAEPGNVTVRQIFITYLFRREGGNQREVGNRLTALGGNGQSLKGLGLLG
ncbi:hypothetical protein CSPX01_04541 [Colletotrichum filicis]|nr:hypothetical protein CSPX01_04541 [Colletotrichum filicis]